MCEFERGFNFATDLLSRGINNPNELAILTEEAEDFGEFTDFDKGINAAIKKWEEQHG